MQSQRRISNSILEIKDANGCLVSSFQEIANVGKDYFSKLFREPLGQVDCRTIQLT